MIPSLRTVLGVGSVWCLLAACGSDGGEAESTSSADTTAVVATPQIVVTTDILGDIVSEVVGDLADVEVVMPSGSSPHEFQASARQAEAMEHADLLVVNGAGFEAGMSSLLESIAEGGTPVFAFADAVELRAIDEDHDDHDDEDDQNDHEDEDAVHEDHEDEDEDADHDGHDHEAGDDDPHLWTDPQRISAALTSLQPVLDALDGVDDETLAAQVDSYLGELEALTVDIEQTLSVVPPNRRTLITNHEVFGYFAERFDFHVAGAIIPSLTTEAEASAAGLSDLVDLIEAEGVPAIFVESTQSTRLAESIADDSDVAVEVVQLFSESLGGPGSGADTYLSMMRTNATLISDALAS